jgi:predicted nuclease with TOPRIM domain|tara:strand:- start:3421 stop:3711 length:291 start_codon:yes stop_codon:yes gene_type:complete
MSNIHLQINNLERLAERLVHSHEGLQGENFELKQKVEELEGKLREKNSELALLEAELKNAQVAKGIVQGGQEVNLAKAKISSLVREIDRCIALLNE